MKLLLVLVCSWLARPAATGVALQESPAPRHALRIAEGAGLELSAVWEPCRTSLYGLFESTPVLRSPAPARERERHGAERFRAFLPPGPVALGEVWRVADEAVLAFLKQLHPGAVLRGHFDGGEVPGTYASLRAVSDEAFELLLRAHAVFQLEEGVIYKPAQFEGRLFVARESGALLWFRLELPSRDTNVDVNVPADHVRDGRKVRSMSADIGWVPRMELASGEPPSLAWTQEVPLEEARLALRRSFYTFAALDWLPFDEAVLRSRRTETPLHLVLLFGALDDDSC